MKNESGRQRPDAELRWRDKKILLKIQAYYRMLSILTGYSEPQQSFMITEKNIKEVKDLIIEAEEPDKIIIFGSCARGAAKGGSDLDILVIKETLLPSPQRSRKLRKLLSDQPFPKDILVLTPDEFNRWADIPFSFNSTVRREGKIIYERSICRPMAAQGKKRLKNRRGRT